MQTQKAPRVADTADTADLGPVLGATYENPIHGCFLIVALIPGLLVGGFVGVIYFSPNGQHTLGFWLSTLLSAAIFVGPFMLMNRLLRREFRIHEHGVSKNNEVLFDAEIVSFRFGVTETYLNGIYTGNEYQIALSPFPDAGRTLLTFSAKLNGTYPELFAFRDRLANRLGALMMGLLQQRQEVPWLEGCQLHPDGLRVKPRRMFRESPETFIPYADLCVQLEKGNCSLTNTSTGCVVATVSSNEENFWPGYFVVVTIVQAAKGTS